MTKRNPFGAWILSILTCGIYALYWEYTTSEEMKAKGAEIPSFIFVFIPVVGFWWLWKYCEGIQKVTGGKTSAGSVFILWFVLLTGIIVAQGAFNNVE